MKFNFFLGSRSVGSLGSDQKTVAPGTEIAVRNPAPVSVARPTPVESPANEIWGGPLDVEGRIDKYHLIRERQMLELARERSKRVTTQLDSAFEELDLSNVQGVLNGEDCIVPPRRGRNG